MPSGPVPFVKEWKYGLGDRISEMVRGLILSKDGISECVNKPWLGMEISDEAVRKYIENPEPGIRRMNSRYQWLIYT